MAPARPLTPFHTLSCPRPIRSAATRWDPRKRPPLSFTNIVSDGVIAEVVPAATAAADAAIAAHLPAHMARATLTTHFPGRTRDSDVMVCEATPTDGVDDSNMSAILARSARFAIEGAAPSPLGHRVRRQPSV